MAAKHGVELDIIPFTEIHFRDSDDLRQRVEALAREHVTAVVTSRNGLLKLMPKATGKWKTFCLGDYSKEFENQHDRFLNIDVVYAKVSGADELADVVIQQNVKKVVFFCGDQRMDILPDKLSKAGVELEELVVYYTMPTPVRLQNSYSGILFYSPAVVRSFFEVNNYDAGCVAFAIGKSTAAELARHGVGEVVTAVRPDKAELLGAAVDYLSK